MSNDTKGIFFLTICIICFWLILDAAVGKKYVRRFLHTIIPFISIDELTGTTEPNKTGTTKTVTDDKGNKTTYQYNSNNIIVTTPDGKKTEVGIAK